MPLIQRRCRHPKCDKLLSKAGMSHCPKHRRKLLSNMMDMIGAVKGHAATLYVGRSAYPERRLIEHLRDRDLTHLFPLHWATEKEEAVVVEKELIERVKKKYRKAHFEMSTGGKSVGEWHAVYVAWARAKNAGQFDALPVREVADLDWGNRLLPQAAVTPETAVVLRVAIDKTASKGLRRELGRFYSGRRERIHDTETQFEGN